MHRARICRDEFEPLRASWSEFRPYCADMTIDAGPSTRAPLRDVLLLVGSIVIVLDRIGSGLIADPGDWRVWARWATVVMWTWVSAIAVRSLMGKSGR